MKDYIGYLFAKLGGVLNVLHVRQRSKINNLLRQQIGGRAICLLQHLAFRGGRLTSRNLRTDILRQRKSEVLRLDRGHLPQLCHYRRLPYAPELLAASSAQTDKLLDPLEHPPAL